MLRLTGILESPWRGLRNLISFAHGLQRASAKNGLERVETSTKLQNMT
jgi:hypothetical protein